MRYFIILIIFFSLSCGRKSWNEDVKNTKTVCELTECSLEEIEKICSEYPYVSGEAIPTGLWNKLECVYCVSEVVGAKKVNDFCKNKKGEKK